MQKSRRTLICYLGNPIVKNDCIGYALGRRLEQFFKSDARVVVREFTGSPLDFISETQGFQQVLIVDAMVTGTVPAGTVKVLTETDLERYRVGASAHSINLPEALALARTMHIPMPERVSLIGIEVAWSGEFGEELAPELADQLERIYKDVLVSIERMTKSKLGTYD
ncbi:MAG: hydrogenase maturation protease [Kiritimatiellaeota bacterium]|nr:hydrogenase maturation protease [Kiritimatiellota bacterium]